MTPTAPSKAPLVFCVYSFFILCVDYTTEIDKIEGSSWYTESLFLLRKG